MVKIDTTTKKRHDASMSPADSLHTRQRRSDRVCSVTHAHQALS